MVGVVTSDRMTKTVVVTVDRRVRHSVYSRVVRRQSKFMAHDDLGCCIGDKVRVVETRPLSARKRWRVVEIIQKGTRLAEGVEPATEIEPEIKAAPDAGTPDAGAEGGGS
jgi:small subunit ribosomal protein S17